MLQGKQLRVFLDNNFWNYLADHNIDLSRYFPESRYELFITTQGRFEILQFSSNKNQHVKEYALKALDTIVKVDAIFGFHNDLFPAEHQRASGFGVGRFSDKFEELEKTEFISKYGTFEKRKKSQILFKQEADIELAQRSKCHPVITFESKKGPLFDALTRGWKVIPLNFERSRIIKVDDFMAEIIIAIENKRG